jgi:hypothetical protein
VRPADRSLFVASLGVAVWWLAGCRDVPAPDNGIQSVSPVQLPLPALVVGDTMRDSTGAVASLGVIAYALDGEPVSPQPTPSFVVLDRGAHAAGTLLIGDSVTTVRVVGEVGDLQTLPVSVKVTLSPDTIVAGDSILHRKTYSIITGDTVAASADLSVRVLHFGTDTSGVEAVIVRYSIDEAPAGTGQGPTVVLVSGNTLSSRDTTDASGRAARVARLRFAALTNSVEDTVRVSATTSYRGSTLGTIQFTIVYTRQ